VQYHCGRSGARQNEQGLKENHVSRNIYYFDGHVHCRYGTVGGYRCPGLRGHQGLEQESLGGIEDIHGHGDHAGFCGSDLDCFDLDHISTFCEIIMRFQYWTEGLIFIGLFSFIVGLPCLMVAILGTRLINHLGQHPSKSARLQMITCVQLLAVEIFSFGVLAIFFHIFSD
jgi:hypothetical protein